MVCSARKPAIQFPCRLLRTSCLLLKVGLKFATLSQNCLCGGMQRVNADLRRALQPFDIKVDWLAAGKKAQALVTNPEVPSEVPFGRVVAGGSEHHRAIGRALHDSIVGGRYDGVFVNVLGGLAEANVMRYLPRRVFRVMIVHSITRGTYRYARAIRDHVHLAVGVSPRIQADLVRKLRFPREDTLSIFNAVDTARFDFIARDRHSMGGLRLISLGRLEDTSKQLSLLPKVLHPLNDRPWTLTVAGDGPDREKLIQSLAPFGRRVRFIGAVSHADVPRVFSEHDVFLMPSRFEGCPVTLIEAMAAGVVPVASYIPGVTDAIITQEKDGLLFQMGNARAAARLIWRLGEDKQFLDAVSQAAWSRARDRCFNLHAFGSAYAGAIRRRLATPRKLAAPLPINQWDVHPHLRGRSWIPTFIRPFCAHLYYKFRK